MNAGDHLFVKRMGYTHHGLYMGDGRVIHYEGPDLGQPLGLVSEVSLACFAQGEEVRVQDYPFRVHGAEQSVRRAKGRLGEECYNLFLNNCEHFVLWCIMGVQFSKQVAGLGLTSAAFFARLATDRTAHEALKAVVGPGTTKAILARIAATTGLTTAGSSALAATTTGGAVVVSAATVPLAPIIVPAAAIATVVAVAVHWDDIPDLVDAAKDGIDDLKWKAQDVLIDGTEKFFDGVDTVVDNVVEPVVDFLFGWLD